MMARNRYKNGIDSSVETNSWGRM